MSKRILSIVPARSTAYCMATEKEQNVIGKRLSEARQANGWTLAELRDRLSDLGMETSRSCISKWETGVNAPNAYQLVALCKALGIVDDISELTASRIAELNMEGLQKVRAYRADLIASGNYTPAVLNEANSIEYVDMPLADLPASAGPGAFLDSCGYELFSFPKASVPAKADFALRVSGDSMEPIYNNGQIVWVQECTELRPGQVGIFLYDGCGYIKVLGEQEPNTDVREFYETSDGRRMMQPVLISYNKAYSPIVISPHREFKMIGKVL